MILSGRSTWCLPLYILPIAQLPSIMMDKRHIAQETVDLFPNPWTSPGAAAGAPGEKILEYDATDPDFS